MKKFIPILLLMTACGSSEPALIIYDDSVNCPYESLPIPIDTGGSELNFEIIETWNRVMDTEVFVDDPASTLSIMGTSDIENDANASPGQVAASLWSCDTTKTFAMIYFDNTRAWNDDEYHYAIAHELGHVIGMNHTSIGLMREEGPLDDLEADMLLMKPYFNILY